MRKDELLNTCLTMLCLNKRSCEHPIISFCDSFIEEVFGQNVNDKLKGGN
jgi:hypothetical protein